MAGIKELAQAVIDRAKADLSAREESPQQRAGAVEFLTATCGEWKRSRKLWCEVAGRDESVVVADAKKILVLWEKSLDK